MNEEKCPFHAQHEKRISNLEESNKDLEAHLADVDKNTAVSLACISKSLETLTKLPESFLSMEKALGIMQKEIKDAGAKTDNLEQKFDSKIDALSKTITEIDNDGKVNIRKWIKSHWFEVTIGITAIVAFGTWFIKIKVG